MIFYCIKKGEEIRTGKVFSHCMKKRCKCYRLFRNKARLENYCWKIERMRQSYPN
ncbi:MAG: hypothetical protein V1867_00940 [Candidatus Falkowbacteria bacterium]